MATGILKYRKYQGKVPATGEMKWYVRAVQDRTVEFGDLVSHISEHGSPYSRGVIAGVLTDMLDCVQELILDGKSVRLGDLGLFSVGLTSGGAQTRADAGAGLVKGVKLIVRNTKAWSNAELFNKVRLSEIDAYEGEDETSGDGDGSGSGSDNTGTGGTEGGGTESGGTESGGQTPDSDLDQNPFG